MFESIELGMTIRMVVSSSILVKIRIWNVDLELDIRNIGVDFVEYTDERLIFVVENSTNR